MVVEVDRVTGMARIVYVKQSIYDFFEHFSFKYPKEVLTSYALSLATKPFVILTGISGTGKTKIAQIFAEYLHQDSDEEEKKKRIAFIPVRPDWMDNRGLLGFYNPLTNLFEAPQLLRLLLQARDEPEVPHFVILDEMNIAKVEYYFSDFLSVMESRTTGSSQGEPLRLHDQGEAVKTVDGLEIRPTLHIPENVYFTGTVNVDESTYMFSPKVLDRANVIEFNEVDLDDFVTPSERSDVDFSFKAPDVRTLFQGGNQEPFSSKSDFDAYKRNLNRKDPIANLYKRLKPFHLHFGYRAINEIAKFINLAQENVANYDHDLALDFQILQKILPKLHGTQGKLQKPLMEILAFCYDLPQGTDPGDACIEAALSVDTDATYPRTAQKTARMLRTLREQGYVSFIE